MPQLIRFVEIKSVKYELIRKNITILKHIFHISVFYCKIQFYREPTLFYFIFVNNEVQYLPINRFILTLRFSKYIFGQYKSLFIFPHDISGRNGLKYRRRYITKFNFSFEIPYIFFETYIWLFHHFKSLCFMKILSYRFRQAL